MNYAEALKRFREDNELKQKDIADVINTTQQQYSLYETGMREMRSSQIIKICSHYGISADYILGLPQNLKYPRR